MKRLTQLVMAVMIAFGGFSGLPVASADTGDHVNHIHEVQPTVIHPCSWGDESPDSPIPLQSPFAAGTAVIVGGVGSFYGDGHHNDANNDYYATDWSAKADGSSTNAMAVYAVADGRIASVGWTSLGYTVVIDHAAGVRTTYGHLTQNSASHLRAGQSVATSTQIGTVGNTAGAGGNSTGAHLHLQFRVNGISRRGQSARPSPMDGQKLCDGQAIRAGEKRSGSNPVCPSPSQNSPSAGQVLSDRRITFSWQSPGCGQGYTLRIKDTSSMDSGGTTIYDQGVGDQGTGGTSQTVEIAEQWVGRTLYWGVRAANASNASWAVRSFQVQLANPGPTSCNPSADQVAFFEHANYAGRCSTVNIGAYSDPAGIGYDHDITSSLRVGSNVRVTVFEHPDYGGRSETFTGDDANLTDNAIGNDSVSSARIERRTSNDACTGPSLGGPGDGATLSDPNVTFQWSAPANCTFQGYTFRIKDTATMEQGGTTIVDAGVGETSIQRAIPAEWHQRDLYWGVRTANPLSPNWSVRRFRVVPQNSGESDPQALGSGQSIDARIDPANEDDTFTFSGTQGQVATITMDRTDSSNLDSYIELFGPAGLIRYDDDGNGNLNSRLVVALPQTGSFRILAHSYGRRSSGAYRIQLTLSTPGSSDGDDGRWLNFGQSLQGSINPNTDRDTYYFNAVAGRLISLRMTRRNTSLDGYLELYDSAGTKIAENDDSGGDRNAWLVATLPGAGTYRVVSRSYAGASGGDYTISLEALAGNNLARGKAAYASSVENNSATFAAGRATDGDMNTRWSSAQSDNQWIYVDLGSERSFNQVVLRWERAFADGYEIYINGGSYTSWHRIYSTTSGDGNIDAITFEPKTARYVLLYGRHRYAHDGWLQFGFSLWEFEVYNTLSALVPTVPPDSDDKEPENLVPLIPLPPHPADKDAAVPSQGTEQENMPVPGQAGVEAPSITPGEEYAPPVTGIELSADRAVSGADQVRLTAANSRDSDQNGDGIVAYRWESNIDGFLGAMPELQLPAARLSVGLHMITLVVQDNEGNWSAPATAVIDILPPDASNGTERYRVHLPLLRR